MYTIEKKDFGFKLTWSGFIKIEEMRQWVEEFSSAIEEMPNGFGVYVDMRELKALPGDSQQLMEIGQAKAKEKGLTRSIVLVDSAITSMQFKRIAKESGIYEWERYIDDKTHPNWEKVCIDWIVNGIDPDDN